jgi:hypothetical protein
MPMFIASRCALLTFLLNVLFSAKCFSAEAPRSSRLIGGISPNHHFEVIAVQKQITTYRLRDIVRGKVIKVIRGTFQYDAENGTRDWTWHMSKSTDVYWNADSSLVAIDEYPWNRSGQVTIVALGNSRTRAREVPIPEKTILAQSGHRWDTFRLRVNDGWITARRLPLNLGGQTILTDRPPWKYGNAAYEAIIEISPTLRVKVLSVKPEHST